MSYKNLLYLFAKNPSLSVSERRMVYMNPLETADKGDVTTSEKNKEKSETAVTEETSKKLEALSGSEWDELSPESIDITKLLQKLKIKFPEWAKEKMGIFYAELKTEDENTIKIIPKIDMFPEITLKKTGEQTIDFSYTNKSTGTVITVTIQAKNNAEMTTDIGSEMRKVFQYSRDAKVNSPILNKQSEIKDFRKQQTIPSEQAGLIAEWSKNESNKNFDAIDKNKEIENTLKELGIEDEHKAPVILKKIVGNKQFFSRKAKLSIEDIFDATGLSDKYDEIDEEGGFEAVYEDLYERKETLTNDEKNLFQQMEKEYLAAKRLIEILKTAKFEAQTQTTIEQDSYGNLQLADKATEGLEVADNSFYSINALHDGKETKTMENGLGISNTAFEESKTKVSDKLTAFETIRMLIRAYGLKELISKGHIQKTVDQKNHIIVSLPDNFTKDNGAKTQLLTYASSAEMPTAAAREIQRALKSNEAYENELRDALKKLFERYGKASKKEQYWLERAVYEWIYGVGTNPTLRDAANGQKYYVSEVSSLSPESMAARILANDKVKIDGEDVTIWTYEKGNNIYSEEGMKKLINHLLYLGAQQLEVREREALYDYNFRQVKGEDFEAQESAETSLKTFISNPTQENWEKIPGHKRVDSIIDKEPFSETENKYIKIADFLKETPRFDLEDLIKKFLLEKIKKAYKDKKPISQDSIDGADNVLEEYQEVIRLTYKLEKKEKKDEKELTDLRERYNILKPFIDPAVALARSFEALGIEYKSVNQRYEEAKIKDEENVLDAIHNLGEDEEKGTLLVAGHKRDKARDESRQSLEAEKQMGFSENEYIRKIQEDLLKKGYKGDLKKVEDKVVGFLAAKLKNSNGNIGLDELGGGIFIPLDDEGKFKLALGVSNEQAGLGIVCQVFEKGKHSGNIVLGAGYNWEDGGPVIGLGYVHGIKDIGSADAERKVKIDIPIGAALGITKEGVSAGAGVAIFLAYDRESSTSQIYRRKRGAMSEVDILTSDKAKYEAIKKLVDEGKLPSYKLLFEEGLTEEDVMAVYKEQYRQNAIDAAEEAETDSIITSLGFFVSVFPPVIGPALKIEIGSVTLVKPTDEGRKKIAEYVSQNKIQEQLAIENLKFISDSNSAEIYLGKDGKLYPAKVESKNITNIKDETGLKSQLEKLKSQLGKARIDILVKEIDGKKRIELLIGDRNGKDIDLYRDPNSPVKLVKINNHIYLSGNLEKLIVSRETFSFDYPKKDGGASMKDIIIFTDNPNFNRDDVINTSKDRISQHWFDDNKATPWKRESGGATYGTETVQDSFGEDAEFTDKIAGVDAEKFKERSKEADKSVGARSKTDIINEGVRTDWINVAKKTFASMLANVKQDKPGIYNREAIILKANQILEPDMNDLEAGQFYSIAMHQYFIDLWPENSDGKQAKEKVKKLFIHNNSFIRDNVLKPQFTTKLAELSIEIPTGFASKEAYATHLANLVYKKALDNFTTTLDSINTRQEFLDKIVPVKEGQFLLSGSSIRATQKGILPGAPQAMALEGIDRMGTIGQPISFDTSITDEKNIARMIFDISHEQPKTSKLDSFQSAFSLSLYVFDGTQIYMGDEDYSNLIEFYKMSDTDKQNVLSGSGNGEVLEAVQKFVEFSEKVKEAQAEATDGKPSYINLGHNYKMYVAKPTTDLGLYGQCGNISFLNEAVFALVENEKTLVATNIENVHMGQEVSGETIALWIALGIPLKGKNKEKTPPKEGGSKVNKDDGTTAQGSGDETPDGSK